MSVPFLDLKPAYAELQAQIDAAHKRVMQSGWFILGPEVEAFEAEFAAYCGAKHCVGVANGLDALELCLRAFDVGPGDEVIVPSNTYIATWLAASAVGATPVPVEPDPRTHNIDPALIEAAITARTKIILPVHLYGQTADMDPIMAIADKHGLKVVEDVRAGARRALQGPARGQLGRCRRLQLLPDQESRRHRRCRRRRHRRCDRGRSHQVLRNYGSRKKYVNEVQGTNSRLDELQAAILRAKLPSLDAWNERRRDVARHYLQAFAPLATLQSPHVPNWAEPVWHQFVVAAQNRQHLSDALDRAGIGWLIHYPIPPHLQQAYAGMNLKRGAFPIAERLADQVLSLPIGPHMTPAQTQAVAHCVVAAMEVRA